MPTPYFADLVRELCQGGGTGPLTPTGAVPGHRRFADAVTVDTSFHYSIAGIAQPAQWEVGLGRIDATGRLVRDTVSSSSNANAPVDFAPGLKTIALTVGAGWFAASDAAGAAFTASLAVRQPLSTTHDAAATGVTGDVLTVRRGSGWVNIPLSSLAFRDAAGSVAVPGPVAGVDGNAAAPAVSFLADPDTGIFRPTVNSIALTTGGAERLRLNAAGQVGIGVTTPAARLEVGGAGSNRILVTSDLSGSLFESSIDLRRAGVAGGARIESIRNAALGGVGLAIKVTANNAAETAGTYTTRLTVAETGNVTPGADNAQAIGAAALRWSVVYAGTGTINTSDAREKAWRGAASATEIRAARRIAADLGFYQWNHAIADKGADRARYHFGIRAQAVWAIMADEGLVDPLDPAGRPGAARYAFLCWDEWTEDGAARWRFGIRPDQLALFLIAAQEQRLAALEAAT